MLTVLGTNPKSARYTLYGNEIEAMLAPAALFDLLPEEDRPTHVLAICTPEAKQDSWPLLKQALNGRCQDVERVDVAGAETQEDVATYLTTVTSAVPGDADLTVDLTHGFRHFSFLTYVAVLYLNALREVPVRGAWYGLLNSERPSPFLDLRPLLNLPDWIYAVRVLGETGSALPIAKVIRHHAQPGSAALEISDKLSWFSEAYLAGTPIELGRHAHAVRQKREQFKRTLEQVHQLPLAQELVERFDKTLSVHALTELPSGNGWKKKIALSEAELHRQAQFVDNLLEHGNTAAALGLMNEWTVSWVLLRRGWEREWLDYERTRRKAAGLLNAMGAVGNDKKLQHLLSPGQRSLGMFWKNLGSLRNAYHHQGMRPQVLVGEDETEQRLACVLKFWRRMLRKCPDFSLLLGEKTGGKVLVSPIGNAPGVLYSALHVCGANGGQPPSLCIAVCSRKSEEKISDAAKRANYSGVTETLRFKDPYGGIEEIKPLTDAARPHLIGADEVLVNVTGGTTLMGLAAEKVAKAARDLACPSVRRFGLIDRRPPEQQKTDPYRVGALFWLDRAGEHDAD